jgi:hypothetical protein
MVESYLIRQKTCVVFTIIGQAGPVRQVLPLHLATAGSRRSHARLILFWCLRPRAGGVMAVNGDAVV